MDDNSWYCLALCGVSVLSVIECLRNDLDSPLLRAMIGLYVVCKIYPSKRLRRECWLGACMSGAIMPDYADRFALCLIQWIA